MEASHLVVYSRDAALDDESGVVCDHGLVDCDRHPLILELPSLNDPAKCQNYNSHPKAVDRQPPAHHVCWSGLTVSSGVPLNVRGYGARG